MGTLINVAGVLLGGLIGLIVKGGLPKRISDILMQALGLCTMFIGIAGALSGMLKVEGNSLQAGGSLLLIFSLGIGAITGEILHIEDHMEGLAVRLKRRYIVTIINLLKDL